MSIHRSLIAFAALTALTFPATALAADSTGTSGTLESVEINHSTADTYLQYHGRIVIEGGGRMTEYRWGGTSCSNKTLPLELVAMLWDALAQRDAFTLTPRYQSGQGSNKCLVGFSLAPMVPVPAAPAS